MLASRDSPQVSLGDSMMPQLIQAKDQQTKFLGSVTIYFIIDPVPTLS